jgi:hypothetical protein
MLFGRYKAEEQKIAVKEVESTVHEYCTVHLCQKKYVGTHMISAATISFIKTVEQHRELKHVPLEQLQEVFSYTNAIQCILC